MTISRPICGMLLHAYYVRDPRVERAAHALRDAGWIVKVICLNEGEEARRETIDGVEVIRTNLSRKTTRTSLSYALEYASFIVRSFFRLWREDFKARHDMVIVHNMPNALVFATLPLRLRGCAVILDMHDAAPETFKSLFGVRSNLLLRLVRIEEALAMRFASGLTTVNRGIERVLRNRHPWAQFELIHNSPSGEYIENRKAVSLDENGAFRILFHGHLHERNGVQRLLEALPAIRAVGIRVEFHVHGDGPFRYELVELTNRLELTDHVYFHGAFRPDALPNILADMHVGVNLHFRDDFGDLLLPVKILEYAHAGIPIITSRLSTVAEYFSDQSVNYFEADEDIAEKLQHVFSDYTAALDRAASAKKVAESISWANDAARLVKFVESKCNSK